MRKFMSMSIGAALSVTCLAHSVAADDVITRQSSRPFIETLSRLEAVAKQKGLVVFGRLDHAGAAAAMGLKMPASTVLVVGNPKVGTERFVKFPTYAIDLPLKVLVWEDEKGVVSVTYNTAPYLLMINKRHGLPTDESAATQANRTQQLMEELAQAATQ